MDRIQLNISLADNIINHDDITATAAKNASK